MTSRNTRGTNLCTCKSNGLKCVTACGDCRGYDCNNSNFTDCKIAETDIDSSSNEEDDFNDENMFERICSEFQFMYSVFINFFTGFDLYLEIMKEYNLKLKHVGITKNNVEFQYIN